MDIRFAEPVYLFLLLLLPVVWIAGTRLRRVGTGRRWTIMTLRSLIILLLVLSLSKVEITRKSKDLTVYFLLDRSESVPAQVKDASAQIINELMEAKGKDDEVGIILFGGDPSIETMAVPKLNELTGEFKSIVDTSATDISSAIRLALSAFPNNSMNRIVLVTDGNENTGSALETARLAANSNVPIDIVPLRYKNEYDVRIDKIVVPQRTQKDQPFELKIFTSMSSGEDQSSGPKSVTGTLRVFEDEKLIAEETITVDEGKNAPLVLPRRLQDGGFHRYRATFEAAGDQKSQNNQAQAFTNLIDKPRVLLVEGDPTLETNFLAGALQIEDIQLSIASPNEIPVRIEELQTFDSIILSNVAAGDMSRDQMKMIERAVHDLGLGLVMIGGENSFGAGGYQDTPIEAALPVSMDVKQKKVLPNGALVIILHTVEIPSGNTWAREISMAALDVLSAQDYFGLLYFGQPPGGGGGQGYAGYSEYWLWEPGLQQTGDKKAMRNKIRGASPQDMQVFDPTLTMAYNGLKNVKAQAKHIVIISDGDPSPPSKSLVTKIRDEGITVSGVGIAPHHEQDVKNLEIMANWGSGEFYYPKNANELPRIFTKEAAVIRRSLIFEQPFFPVSDAYSETLDGVAGLPQLGGYVVTSDKELSTIALRTENDDPLLAHWRYGLGKTVAFTSDAKNKWASNWTSWDGFSKFWSQVIRWSIRETSSSNLQVNTEISDGSGKIIVDALNVDGDFENFLEFDTTVLGPDLEPQNVTVRQVGPGRYEGEFDAKDVGTYMVRLNSEDEDGAPAQTVVTGAALSYSPEHETTQSNENFLDRIADETRGDVAGADYNAFRPTVLSSRRPEPLWEWLLLIGLLLIPFDVFVRRVYLDFKEMLQATANALAFWKPKTVDGPDTGMGSLLATKTRVKEERFNKEEEEERKQSRKRFRDQVREGKSEASDKDSVFSEAKKSGSSAKPVRKSQKHTVSDSPQSGGGLSGLKKAKDRARKKMK